MQETDTIFSQFKKAVLHNEQSTVSLLKDEIKDFQREIDELRSYKEKAVDHKQLELHFDEKLTYMQEHFPDLFGEFVTRAIRVQIRESQAEVIDALYPIMGKLIGKYIRVEIEKLSQQIDMQLEKAFSLEGLWLRIKAFLSGVKYEDLILRNSQTIYLEEVFLISEGSGLLLGQYSRNSLLDSDIIAGMLTGIKQFVADAFQKDQQNLDTLGYDDYEIVVFNFQTFYIACVVKGQLLGHNKEKLYKAVLAFCEQHQVAGKVTTVDSDHFEEYSSALKAHFYGFNEMD